MKNRDENILMTEKEIKQLQNKRKKLIRQQKQEERKKRDRRFYEKGAFFESIFFERKDFSKDEFYQLITYLNSREEIHSLAQRKNILSVFENLICNNVDNHSTGLEEYIESYRLLKREK